jgi:hypothetical protein
MEYFHPESKTLIEHPECACCGKVHQGNIGGFLAIYETSKDLRTETRTYFPYLHLVCEICFSKYEDIWSGRMISGRNYSISEELETEMKKDAPQWSMLSSLFTCKHRPFVYVGTKMSYNELKNLLHIVINKTLPREITDRIYGFSNSSDLVKFAYNVNGEADIDYWTEHIL